jgi:hypothetical protein
VNAQICRGSPPQPPCLRFVSESQPRPKGTPMAHIPHPARHDDHAAALLPPESLRPIAFPTQSQPPTLPEAARMHSRCLEPYSRVLRSIAAATDWRFSVAAQAMPRIVGSGAAVGWPDDARRMAVRGDLIRMRLQPECGRVTSFSRRHSRSFLLRLALWKLAASWSG